MPGRDESIVLDGDCPAVKAKIEEWVNTPELWQDRGSTAKLEARGAEFRAQHALTCDRCASFCAGVRALIDDPCPKCGDTEKGVGTDDQGRTVCVACKAVIP